MLKQGGSLTGIAAAREGVASLRAYAWAAVALALVGLAIGYLAGAPEEESKYSAWVTAEALGANGSVTDLGISTPPGPQAADLLGDGIVNRVEASTGRSYDYLIEHLELSQPPDGGPNPPIALIAKGDSMANARALLGDWMAAVHAARLHYVSGVLARGERGLRKSLHRAVNRVEPATEKAIVDLLARMQAERATLSVDYAIQSKPRPFDESTVSRPRSAAIGGFAGLIAALALALLLSLVSGRLRTAEGVEAALGVELLADLWSPRGTPSREHARERLRSLGNGQLPPVLLLLPCGSVPSYAAARVSDVFGEGVEARVAGPLGQPGLLGDLDRSEAWAIIASPGTVRRAEVAALRAEIGGIGVVPAGLVLV